LNKANKVEKSWTNFKYSVNNEENKDNDELINRNNVESGQPKYKSNSKQQLFTGVRTAF
jgi:hypothetical protein